MGYAVGQNIIHPAHGAGEVVGIENQELVEGYKKYYVVNFEEKRINEIGFNSSLLRELRAINFVKRLIAEGKVQKGVMKDVLIHMIADDGLMNDLSIATKLVPSPYVINMLKAAGRAATEAFLKKHSKNLGREGTVNLPEMFA